MSRLLGRMVLLLATIAISTATGWGQETSDLDSLNQQADVAYRRQDFPVAVELATKALEIDPQNHVALYLRGSSRVELGMATGNAEQLRQGIADARQAIGFEGSGKAEYYLPYIYGMSHLALLEHKPAHAQTALTVADSVLEREDLSAEQRSNLLYQRAQSHAQLNDIPAAEADLAEAIHVSPDHLAAYMMQADLATNSKKPAEAVAAYSKVVEKFPEEPVTYSNRGMYLLSLGRYQEAIQDFTKAIQLDQQFMPAYINRGYAYLQSGDPKSAEAALTEALAVDGSQIAAISLRARARMDQNKTADALADYKQAAQLAPYNPMSHGHLGFAQFFAGNYADALTSFNAALKVNPQLRFLLPWKLACEIRTGQIDRASYESSSSKPAENRDWVDHLVMFELGQEDVKTMLSAIQSDKEAHDAQMCEAYYFIGVELQRRGRSEDAQAYWKQAAQQKLPELSAYRGAVFALKNSGAATR